MGMDIKEVVMRKARPLWQTLLIILSVVVLINSLITLCNLLGQKYAGIASLVVLFTSLVVCVFFIINRFSSYTYILQQGELIFERFIGNKRRTLLKIKIQ